MMMETGMARVICVCALLGALWCGVVAAGSSMVDALGIGVESVPSIARGVVRALRAPWLTALAGGGVVVLAAAALRVSRPGGRRRADALLLYGAAAVLAIAFWSIAGIAQAYAPLSPR